MWRFQLYRVPFPGGAAFHKNLPRGGEQHSIGQLECGALFPTHSGRVAPGSQPASHGKIDVAKELACPAILYEDVVELDQGHENCIIPFSRPLKRLSAKGPFPGRSIARSQTQPRGPRRCGQLHPANICGCSPSRWFPPSVKRHPAMVRRPESLLSAAAADCRCISILRVSGVEPAPRVLKTGSDQNRPPTRD